MEYVECPECSSTARRMPVLSYINRTDNVYQCSTCAQISLMPKDASTPPVRLGGGPLRAQAQRA